MIYTVTLNPSIDYVASTTEFAAGKLNRLSEEVFLPDIVQKAHLSLLQMRRRLIPLQSILQQIILIPLSM